MVKTRKKKVRTRQRGPLPIGLRRRERPRARVTGKYAVVTTEPPKGQFKDLIGLTALAYLFEATIPQICGAIRALSLRNDDTPYDAGAMRGCVAGRQQTMVHKSKLKQMGNYLKDGTRL